MKIKRSHRNKYVLIALGLWFVLAIGFFAWLGVQANAYRSQATTYADQVKHILTDANSSLKRAHDEANPTATRDALVALATHLEAKRKLLPSAPSILGQHIGADDTYNKQSRLDVAISVYAADLSGAAEFIDYQQKTTLDLQLLTLKSAGNAEQIVALAAAWEETIATVTNRPPPNQLKEVRATLLQKLSEAKSCITQMGDLYKNNDEAGFKAKYAELGTTIAALKPIGEQITAVAAHIDAQLANDAANIAKNL
jgi:hypothetical protein